MRIPDHEPQSGGLERASREVFPMTFLVWTDQESGEELDVAFHGPEELLASLYDLGFRRRLEAAAGEPADPTRACVRIRASVLN